MIQSPPAHFLLYRSHRNPYNSRLLELLKYGAGDGDGVEGDCPAAQPLKTQPHTPFPMPWEHVVQSKGHGSLAGTRAGGE